MDKKKIIVFIGILAFASVFLFFTPIKNFLEGNFLGTDEPKVLEVNSGEYTIGKEIKAGIYDFTVTKGVVRLENMTAFKGDKIERIELYDKSYFEIGEDGAIKITKAKEEAIIPKDNVYTISSGGTYVIGLQIPVGNYEVKYNNSNKRKDPILIQTNNYDGSLVYESFELKDSFQKINLESNSILDISLSKEYENDKTEIILIKK